MRRCLTLLLLTAGTARAADAPRSNALTPQEIANGWILLFDGETTFGWKTDGDVSVTEGTLRVGGTKPGTVETNASFGECDMSFECRADGPERPQCYLRGRLFPQDMGFPRFTYGNPRGWFANTITIRHDPAGGQTLERRDTAAEGMFRVATKGPADNTGPWALGFKVPAGTTLTLRSVKLKPFHLEPIFNGEDLSGWKQFTGDAQRAKSKFAVTPQGWLNVTNGPGDLQTDKQWADFVFQGECVSNGKHLNSGIFFRCLPGQYQQGYEFQIQNGYKDGDRTKPVDFGAGAIYRRVPARKVVSNDGEWFAMTLIAHGNHIATWVNGYQVVDWTDTRPPNDNARNGCKLGAGPISIQGHDPTTNLSFRNLRVADLKK